uniref:Uncharacterized protein n=1 Tax=Arundo donax TaxID=35708 RepID=A0A0A9D2H4_ARUDO
MFIDCLICKSHAHYVQRSMLSIQCTFYSMVLLELAGS